MKGERKGSSKGAVLEKIDNPKGCNFGENRLWGSLFHGEGKRVNHLLLALYRTRSACPVSPMPFLVYKRIYQAERGTQARADRFCFLYSGFQNRVFLCAVCRSVRAESREPVNRFEKFFFK